MILCKEISMIFPLEIKSLFRPPLLVAFLMSNKIAGAVQEEEDAVCLQVHPSPHFEGGCMSWMRDGTGGARDSPLFALLPSDPQPAW